MDDTISRAAALDTLNGIEIPRNASWYEFYQKALTAVGELPSAQPEKQRSSVGTGERTMTGDEAWKIVGPILAAMIQNAGQWNQKPLEMMSDAYITTYLALKQYGNGEEKNDKN